MDEYCEKEIYDPITGIWFPVHITDEDIMELMLKAEEIRAEEEILRKHHLKSIGATDGWIQLEN
jgi:hypothetical protein|tara:strand:- start:2714 stop:2905 length:192 start_codon:yes stop_codon:yes gene_type:complete